LTNLLTEEDNVLYVCSNLIVTVPIFVLFL